MKLWLVSFWLLSLVVVVSCGNHDGSNPTTGSLVLGSMSMARYGGKVCIQYNVAGTYDSNKVDGVRSQLRSQANSMNATYSEAACPSSGASSSTCRMTKAASSGTAEGVVYYYQITDQATARSECSAMNGIWH